MIAKAIASFVRWVLGVAWWWFSYIDTQITRLGGPNFSQIPINRAHCPVNDMFRDGFHQHAVHGGVAPYRPNSLDGGNPAEAERLYREGVAPPPAPKGPIGEALARGPAQIAPDMRSGDSIVIEPAASSQISLVAGVIIAASAEGSAGS